MCDRRGTAVGLIDVSMHGATARELRLAVSLRAAEEGYAVAEVFDLRGDPQSDAAAYVVAEELAERVEAQAVFVMGTLDRARVEELAARARLVVHVVDKEWSVGQRSG